MGDVTLRERGERAKKILLEWKANTEQAMADVPHHPVIQEVLRNQVTHYENSIAEIDKMLNRLHASCILCGTRTEVQEPTLGYICAKCDGRITEDIERERKGAGDHG